MEPRRVRLIAIVVVVVVVAAGLGTYVYLRSRATSSCGLQSKNPLVIDQAETVGSFDPQVAFSTPEWGAVQQVYQTLDMYNGTSLVNFTAVLAQNWSISSDNFHWNFSLRSGIHFSNGDPFNAYVMWYSLYRLLALQGIDQYLLSENFWYPSTFYGDTSTLPTLVTDLNTFDFSHPNATEQAAMAAPDQSFRALDNRTIQLNLGFGYLGTVPYTYLLAEMATPGAAAVDPIAIDANGGINGPQNSFLVAHAAGTGPYALQSFDPVSGYTIAPDPTYWAAQPLAALGGRSWAQVEPWNNNLQPAKSTIQVVFQSTAAVNVKNLETGAAASASFAYLGPSTIHELQGNSCVVVRQLSTTASGASGSWWVYLNQSVAPFNNLSVREAIAHAIDYSAVNQSAFGGFSYPWVGPVGFGHPYYNPANLPPYSYNLTLAKQEMANSPWPNGFGTTFNFMYVDTGPDWSDLASILQSELAVIGIKINPVPVTLDNFYAEQTIDPSTGQCVSAGSANGGPFFIGMDFYASDYISPDDWTQEDAWTYGSANLCMSGYSNATVDSLTLTAAGEHVGANLTKEYSQITQMMYANYTDIWLSVPYLFSAYNPALTGIYETPMGSTTVSSMNYNTISAT